MRPFDEDAFPVFSASIALLGRGAQGWRWGLDYSWRRSWQTGIRAQPGRDGARG